MCICGLRHPARNEHVPYYIVICGRPVQLYNIFPHYLINGTKFVWESFKVKFLFWFSKQLLPETFLILRRTERDMIINVSVFTWSIHYACQTLTKPKFSQQIFQPILIYQISWKSIQWEPGGSMWTDGRMDGHDKANCHFLQFLNATKN